MSRILGIDLGTSTTCVALVKDGKPEVITGTRGQKVTPSYIYVMEDGRILIGENAKAEAIADPYNTIWATKRLIGRKFNDPNVQECRQNLSYQISGNDNGDVLVHGRGKKFTPIKVASLILKFASRLAANYLGEAPKKAVITVPASFNDLQRKATKRAGESVGLEVSRLVNEPTAAALAWGYHRDAESTVAIYDLGGGTFDVSILAIGSGVYEVVATRGDSWLGGEDFDNRLVDYLARMFKEKTGADIYMDKMAHQRVKTAAEQAKIQLSEQDSARIHIPSPMPDMTYHDLYQALTRSHFESLIEDLVDQTVDTFKNTLADAELDKDEIDNVILVGGMTRIPLVREKLTAFLGRDPDYSVNPDEAVALGAAIHAAALEGEELSLKKPKSGRLAKPATAEDGDTAMVGGVAVDQGMSGQDLPVPKGAKPSAAGLPPGDAGGGEGEWEPEEDDGQQEAPLKGKAPLLIDVLSQSVGIADMAKLFVPLLPRNTKLPAKNSQVFTTCVDNQEAIRISVYQGEERHVADKVMLGEFSLTGIEMASRGVPQILVTFNIDQSGLFTVSAKDLKTNVEKEIKVEGVEL